MIQEKDLTAIGKFQRTHALKGELNLLLDADADFLESGRPLIVDMEGAWVPFWCESIRPKGHFSWLVKLQGVDSEADAKEFVNKEVYALKADMKEFDRENGEDEEGEYAADLVGFKIEDELAGDIGEITAIDLSTANALLVVATDDGDVYIPIADEFITGIDEENRVLHTSLPEGLLDVQRKENK